MKRLFILIVFLLAIPSILYGQEYHSVTLYDGNSYDFVTGEVGYYSGCDLYLVFDEYHYPYGCLG